MTDRYELLHVKPDEAHPWNLIVTKGLAGKKLNVPLGVDELTNSHVELALCLPPEWQFSSSEEYNLWPINALCELINFILAGSEFVGFGYTFSNDKPWHSSTEFSGGMLTALGGYKHQAQEAILTDGSYVRFFELIFLYPMELAFRKTHDAASLLDLFVQKSVRPSPVRKRSDVCAAMVRFQWPQLELQPQLRQPWPQPLCCSCAVACARAQQAAEPAAQRSGHG